MASEQVQPKTFAFIFGTASGHINPSFAVARRLVEQGHQVHYLVREQMREAVEDTGATFHSEIAQKPELYEGREVDWWGATDSLKKEFGLENETCMMRIWTKLGCPQLEMMLPGVVRWLESIKADAVVCCPLMNIEAIYGAKSLGIPCVALLTTAGPGSTEGKDFIEKFGMTAEDLRDIYDTFKPHKEAVRRMNSKYGLTIRDRPNLEPFGCLDALSDCFVTIVTTCESLQDPASPALTEFYLRQGARFECTGPLLDKAGARRAAAHKLKHDEGAAADKPEVAARDAEAEVLAKIRAARAAGRKVVLASMGTVITGDSPGMGWDAKIVGPDGVRRGITGRELCQGAWGGLFDAFGTEQAEEGPLLVVAVGVQPQALGDLTPPANAICEPVLPQVDVLKAGVDLFLTHGGQNSFTEALAHKVPIVVCPGFADQPVNARKAEAIGVGLQVPRPEPEEGQEAPAVAQFRQEVAQALRRVFAEDAFRAKAAECGEQLKNAGGVPRAAELVLAAAVSRPAAPQKATSAEAVQEAVAPCAFAGA